MKTRIKEIIEDFKYKFMYSCSGCTDPKSEGTHQMESVQHWDESKTKAFLTHALTQVEEEMGGEIIDKIKSRLKDFDYYCEEEHCCYMDVVEGLREELESLQSPKEEMLTVIRKEVCMKKTRPTKKKINPLACKVCGAIGHNDPELAIKHADGGMKPPKPTKKDWEEDFNEKFTFGGITGVVAFKEAWPLDVKVFIRTLLATQRKEILEGVRGMKKKDRLWDGWHRHKEFGYVQALTDIEKLIEGGE